MITLGSGFAPYILAHIKQIAGMSTPQMKMEVPGYLNMLLSQSKPEVLKLNNNNGHKRSVSVKAKQRATKGMTDTSKSCDNVTRPSVFSCTQVSQLSIVPRIIVYIITTFYANQYISQ